MPRISFCSAFIALCAVLASGCSGDGKDHQAHSPNAANKQTSALPAPKSVTPQDAGKQVLRLKLNEPVSYQRGGVSITIVPHSMTKLTNTPLGLDGQLIDCGTWWRVDESWTIDVQPHPQWYSWRRDFQGLFGLFSESKDQQHGFYNDIATSATSKEPGDLDKDLGDAAHAWDRKAPLHFQESGPQYLAGCKMNDPKSPDASVQQFVPEERPITGLQLILPTADGQNPQQWPTLAIWTP